MIVFIFNRKVAGFKYPAFFVLLYAVFVQLAKLRVKKVNYFRKTFVVKHYRLQCRIHLRSEAKSVVGKIENLAKMAYDKNSTRYGGAKLSSRA